MIPIPLNNFFYSKLNGIFILKINMTRLWCFKAFVYYCSIILSILSCNSKFFKLGAISVRIHCHLMRWSTYIVFNLIKDSKTLTFPEKRIEISALLLTLLHSSFERSDIDARFVAIPLFSILLPIFPQILSN